jgi:hypothetical protein
VPAEIELVGEVRSWVDQVLPGNSGLADAAVAVALDSFAAGASVGEAAEEARRLVGCWLRHPSRPTSKPYHGSFAAAS